MDRVLIGLAVLGIVGCSSIRPVPIQAGDVCFRCKRTIVDTRLAGQIVDAQGRTLKFRAPLCMAKYLDRHPAGAVAIFVTDYTTEEMFPAMDGTFVRVTVDAASEREYAAFRSATDAARFRKENGGGVVDWIAVRRAAMAPAN